MKLDLVVACDQAFAQHLAVMLCSLVDTNPDQAFRVFVLSDLPDATYERVAGVVRDRDLELVRIPIDAARYRALPTTEFWSNAIYFRLAIGELLPPDVDRVLYLDCDILVRGPIAELWRLDLEGNVIAAVEDRGFFDHQKLGFPHNAPYFNSGVMFVDLARWRAEDIGGQTRRFLENHRHRVTNPDQCALNTILIGRWLVLDRTWNFQTNLFCDYRPPDWLYKIDPRKLPDLYNATIVHFSAQSKPWHYLNDHPLKHRYWDYLERTPWRGYVAEDHTLKNMLVKHSRVYLPRASLLYHMASVIRHGVAKRVGRLLGARR